MATCHFFGVAPRPMVRTEGLQGRRQRGRQAPREDVRSIHAVLLIMDK